MVRECFRKQYGDAGSPGLCKGGEQAWGLFPGCLEGFVWLQMEGEKKKKKKKAAAGSLMKSLDRRVSRVEEHNQTPDM